MSGHGLDIFKLADHMRSMRTTGASKNPDSCCCCCCSFFWLFRFLVVSFHFFLFLSDSMIPMVCTPMVRYEIFRRIFQWIFPTNFSNEFFFNEFFFPRRVFFRRIFFSTNFFDELNFFDEFFQNFFDEF